MFKFLKERKQAAVQREADAVLESCAEELRRNSVAGWQYVSRPRDVAQRAAALANADAAGLSDREPVVQLRYLHGLLDALSGPLDVAQIEVLMADAVRLKMGGTDAVKKLIAVADSAILKRDGLQIIAEENGRQIYLRCTAQFKNRDGSFEVRDDGVTFSGEVIVDIPWNTVKHLAKTTHSYQDLDYWALAFQEGKRRTPTKFAFPTYDHGSAHACDVTMEVWKQNRSNQDAV